MPASRNETPESLISVWTIDASIQVLLVIIVELFEITCALRYPLVIKCKEDICVVFYYF